MPQIKPFCGIYPKQEYVERVIAAPPGFPLSDADRAELTANPNSFLHLIAPPLKNEFLQGPRDALIHRQAAENFQRFLEEGILIKDPEPGLYLYTLEREGILQTGIWTVTLFDDYLNNRVRKHEYTRAERERSIAEYLRQTGIDANPVLIAYPPHGGIERIIEKYRSQPPLISFKRADSRHTLHRVSAPEDLNRLRGYFNELPAAYLADGHHRAAALSSYGVERRKFNFRHTGEEEYNFFSSIYFSADSLEIKSFHRLIKDLNGLHPAGFIEKLRSGFQLRESAHPPVCRPGQLGMYLPGQWYALLPVEQPEKADPVQALDATRLQQHILEPVLGIDDPRTSSRICFAGGNIQEETLARAVDRGEAAVLFSLCPPSIQQLMAVADAGLVMPPKSTWFEPKLDLGILTHYIA